MNDEIFANNYKLIFHNGKFYMKYYFIPDTHRWHGCNNNCNYNKFYWNNFYLN